MVRVKVKDLEGRVLDYAVAKTQGFVWARNVCRRSGDMWDNTREIQYPLGTLCFVPPNMAKGLNPKERNQDGWMHPVGDEPIAPAALQQVPLYSTNWQHGGPLIEKLLGEGFDLAPINTQYSVVCRDHNDDMIPNLPRTWGDERIAEVGPTPLIAACRAIVADKLGDEVDIPEELAP